MYNQRAQLSPYISKIVLFWLPAETPSSVVLSWMVLLPKSYQVKTRRIMKPGRTNNTSLDITVPPSFLTILEKQLTAGKMICFVQVTITSARHKLLFDTWVRWWFWWQCSACFSLFTQMISLCICRDYYPFANRKQRLDQTQALFKGGLWLLFVVLFCF